MIRAALDDGLRTGGTRSQAPVDGNGRLVGQVATADVDAARRPQSAMSGHL
jgi:hypothetical protein